MDFREFHELIANLIPDDDRPLVVYSGLWLFSRSIAVPTRELPGRIVDSLLEVAGPRRTVLMPTYTSGFQDGVIDLDQTPSTTGVITETFRRREETCRTASAFFSFAAVGPEAELLTQLRPCDAWGEGSVFEWIQERDAHLLVLGESCEAISFIHRAEWLAGVPYRYRKTFTGLMIHRARQEQLSECLFVRSQDPPVKNSWRNLENLLLSADMVTLPLGGGQLNRVSAQRVAQVLAKELAVDPFCFTLDPSLVRKCAFQHPSDAAT